MHRCASQALDGKHTIITLGWWQLPRHHFREACV
jgi:hypothetical protein